MEWKIGDDVIVAHSWFYGCLDTGTGGGSLNRTPTQFWRGGEETDTFFGSDRLRIENTWPQTTSLLWRATHLVQVFSSPFCVLPRPSAQLGGLGYIVWFLGSGGSRCLSSPEKNRSKHLVPQLGIWHPMPYFRSLCCYIGLYFLF